MPRTVLVIGGDAAGLGAARAARDADPAAEVVLAERVPAGHPRSPRGVDEAPRRALAAAGVRLLAAPVLALDLDARTLTADGTDPLRFDALVLTEGPAPAGALPGAELAGVHAAEGLPDVASEAAAGTRAVVLGATPAGLAAVAALLARGVETHLVEAADQLLPGTADPDVVAPVAERLTTAGAHLHLSSTAAELLGEDGRLVAVRTAEGAELPAGLAVLATPPTGPALPGSGPADGTAPARAADGRIAVDDRMRTSLPRVFAAGRPAAAPAPTGSHRYAQGRTAGANAAGADRRYHPGYVPWTVAAGQGLVGGAGYGEADAAERGLRYVLARSVGISRARYYPGVQQITVKLLAEPGSLRLIGGQLHGAEGIRERATFLAEAVRLGLTLHDLSTMENVYSPAIGALNEPLVVAATNGLADLAN